MQLTGGCEQLTGGCEQWAEGGGEGAVVGGQVWCARGRGGGGEDCRGTGGGGAGGQVGRSGNRGAGRGAGDVCLKLVIVMPSMKMRSGLSLARAWAVGIGRGGSCVSHMAGTQASGSSHAGRREPSTGVGGGVEMPASMTGQSIDPLAPAATARYRIWMAAL
jgi:hypothetical protein